MSSAGEAMRQRLAGGAALRGGWCHIDNAYATELMAVAGFDWLCLDMQHGLFDDAGVIASLARIRRHGVPVLVRVPEASPAAIGRALDAGAAGVVVPLVEEAAVAAAAVAACRYAPRGTRSVGSLVDRVDRLAGGDPQAPADPLCVVMVETRAGVREAEAIATVPGVDVVFVGPADLALDLGAATGADPPALGPAIETVAAACRAAGVALGAFASPGGPEFWDPFDLRLFVSRADSVLLADAARAAAAPTESHD